MIPLNLDIYNTKVGRDSLKRPDMGRKIEKKRIVCYTLVRRFLLVSPI